MRLSANKPIILHNKCQFGTKLDRLKTLNLYVLRRLFFFFMRRMLILYRMESSSIFYSVLQWINFSDFLLLKGNRAANLKEERSLITIKSRIDDDLFMNYYRWVSKRVLKAQFNIVLPNKILFTYIYIYIYICRL